MTNSIQVIVEEIPSVTVAPSTTTTEDLAAFAARLSGSSPRTATLQIAMDWESSALTIHEIGKRGPLRTFKVSCSHHEPRDLAAVAAEILAKFSG